MAQTKVNKSAKVVERNILLVGEITRYLLNNPEIFNSLPDNFELVILPDDDPEMRLYNLELLDRYGSEGKPIVFARVSTHQENSSTQTVPSLFVPVPLAA
ncbi:MAG: hypothetical protein BroJett011_24070 [Chloroflexota bacterium]|nr:MAG: hypothetical protein BroJett011_24070 [Chloroflexota bacterium]